MPGRRETAYDALLPGHGEFVRVRISTAGGEVVAFTVQDETLVGDRYVPVVRYDAQHGLPHRDKLNRSGDVVDKVWLSMANADALNLGIEDIRTNWQRYKVAFLGGAR